MTFFAYLYLCCAIVVPTLPAAGVGAEPTPAPVYTDPAVPVKARVGEEFVIVLDSNPTTGYSWRLAGGPDESILKLEGSGFEPPRTSRLKGAGGREFWSFRALKEGETRITLTYARPWEKDRPPAKEATFTVLVH